jgi:hypothetical protein
MRADKINIADCKMFPAIPAITFSIRNFDCDTGVRKGCAFFDDIHRESQGVGIYTGQASGRDAYEPDQGRIMLPKSIGGNFDYILGNGDFVHQSGLKMSLLTLTCV